MTTYETMSCEPCRTGAAAATPEERAAFLRDHAGWIIETVLDVPRLIRTFPFPNFRQAMAFAVQVGELAEAAGHHPALLVEWGRVTVQWWTHKIRDLHRNDLIMAAKTDRLAAGGG